MWNPNKQNAKQDKQGNWYEDVGGWDCDLRMPSVQEFQLQIFETLNREARDDEADFPQKRSVAFYTNLIETKKEAMAVQIANWLDTHDIPFFWVLDVFETEWLIANLAWAQEHYADFKKQFDDPGQIFNRCMCQAVAWCTVNPDAYLFTKWDVSWDPESIWSFVEFPQLTHNPFIQRIWLVDPRPKGMALAASQGVL